MPWQALQSGEVGHYSGDDDAPTRERTGNNTSSEHPGKPQIVCVAAAFLGEKEEDIGFMSPPQPGSRRGSRWE